MTYLTRPCFTLVAAVLGMAPFDTLTCPEHPSVCRVWFPTSRLGF
jgi:hypothetical protein